MLLSFESSPRKYLVAHLKESKDLLAVRVPKGTIEELDEIAGSEGCTRNALVRRLLEFGFEIAREQKLLPKEGEE